MSLRIICSANRKGGVGKTTSCVTLAGLLAFRGYRVLIVDFDPQGNCATSLGLKQEPNVFNTLIMPNVDIFQWIRPTGRKKLDILPGDNTTVTAQIVLNAKALTDGDNGISEIRNLFKPLKGSYDFVLLDTAPSAGGIQERAIFASDLVLIPTATEFMSTSGLGLMVATLRDLPQKGWSGKLLGILPTFYDDSTTESKETMKELKENFGRAVLPPIHRATLLREAPAEGKLVFELDPQHRATREYYELSEHILKYS